MSAGSAAAVAGGIAGGLIAVVMVAVLVRLVVAVTKLGSATQELVRAVEDLRQEGRTEDVEGDAEVAENGHRPRPTRIGIDLGLSGPVIKARALGRGTSEAARQLRHSGPWRPAREPREGALAVFKRLFWLMIGAGFGFGMSLWVMRVVRETAERYSPHRISSELAGAARGVSVELRQALTEGREAMRQHEAELRAQGSRRS